MAQRLRRVAQLRTPAHLRRYLTSHGIDLPFDEELQAGAASPLAQPYALSDFTIGNRFCVHPMEGWDGTTAGEPTDLVRRRWTRFGASGAKLIWGGEAVAVRPDGRANPNQLMLTADTMQGIGELRTLLERTHAEHFGATDDLLIGLQLTHSGRFARPRDKTRMEPWLLYEHPVLNPKFHVGADARRMTDDDIKHLIDDFVTAACRAHDLGFHFVDIKHCHGYLGHEFLSAYDRPGEFGGSFVNRTRFLRDVVTGIRAQTPRLRIGVRLSAFDFIPFKPDPALNGQGIPDDAAIGDGSYRYALWRRQHRDQPGSGGSSPLSGVAAYPRYSAGQYHGRQSVLRAPYPASGPVSAFGRIPATGRPAGRCGTPDPGPLPISNSAVPSWPWWGPGTPICRNGCRT